MMVRPARLLTALTTEATSELDVLGLCETVSGALGDVKVEVKTYGW